MVVGVRVAVFMSISAVLANGFTPHRERLFRRLLTDSLFSWLRLSDWTSEAEFWLEPLYPAGLASGDVAANKLPGR